MYYKRACENTIKEMMKSFPAIAVYGPRQCGKSTMLNMLFNDSIESVTLDDIDELNLAQSNPKLFLDSHPVLLSSTKSKRLRFSWKKSKGESI